MFLACNIILASLLNNSLATAFPMPLDPPVINISLSIIVLLNLVLMFDKADSLQS